MFVTGVGAERCFLARDRFQLLREMKRRRPPSEIAPLCSHRVPAENIDAPRCSIIRASAASYRLRQEKKRREPDSIVTVLSSASRRVFPDREFVDILVEWRRRNARC